MRSLLVLLVVALLVVVVVLSVEESSASSVVETEGKEESRTLEEQWTEEGGGEEEEEEELSWESWIDFDMLEDYRPTDEELKKNRARKAKIESMTRSLAGADVVRARDNTRRMGDGMSDDEEHALETLIRQSFETKSPNFTDVMLSLLYDYPSHRLDVITRLAREETRDETIRIIDELIQRDALDEFPCKTRSSCPYLWCPSCAYSAFMKRYPGSQCLLEKVPKSVNEDHGVTRKEIYVSEMSVYNPVLSYDINATPEQFMDLIEYGAFLQNTVIHELRAYLKDKIVQYIVPSAMLSCRAKGGADIYDKVVRMTNGYAGKRPDPDYKVGSVLDAMGCRITLPDTDSLWSTLQLVEKVLKVKKDGAILEIENFYAEPKPSSYAYRVIPIISTFVYENQKYSFELQLTTDRASIAADLFHNTIYKQYLVLTQSQRDIIFSVWEEAAAEEQKDAITILC